MGILININRLGWNLDEEDIDIILQMINESDAAGGSLGAEPNVHRIFSNQLIEWLGIPRDSITREILERYAKMSSKELGIPFTLAKPEKLEQRIISPLVSAKKFACLGEFFASIALSGLVGEMLAIFLWELTAQTRKGEAEVIIQDESLIGEGFSQLPQNQRVNILQAFGYIDGTQVSKFKELSKRRNDILHSWTDSLSREELEKNAMDCYSCAAFLIKGIIKIEFANANSLKVDPRVMAYLQKHGGVVQSVDSGVSSSIPN